MSFGYVSKVCAIAISWNKHLGTLLRLLEWMKTKVLHDSSIITYLRWFLSEMFVDTYAIIIRLSRQYPHAKEKSFLLYYDTYWPWYRLHYTQKARNLKFIYFYNQLIIPSKTIDFRPLVPSSLKNIFPGIKYYFYG